jgi:ElaB/YqjD/DUF883 family membrane-anchored ribosome-binding protein
MTAMTPTAQRAADKFERAKGRMANDFTAIIADSEELLQAAAAVSGEGFAAARLKFEDKLKRAKTALVEASQPALDKVEESAAVANDYVRSNPWTAVGVSVAAGLLIGLLATRR